MVSALYLAKRVGIALFSVFVVTSLVFGMTTALPGTAANIILGTAQTPEAVDQLEQQLGLNQPIHYRYADFVIDVFTLDWGNSFVSGQPVEGIVLPALQRTLELALVAMLFSIFTAIPLGLLAAAKRNSLFDNITLNISYIAISIPSFVSATILLLLFTSPPMDFFPNGGYAPFTEGPIQWFRHLVLPALSINVIILAYVMRQTRSSMIDTLQSEYIRTARLKGVEESKVLLRHALRNGLAPTVTVVAINFGWMMGALVIIEEIFSYPGIGREIVRAIHARDLPVIQVAILIPTIAFILANLTADILYSILDPRIEMGEK